MKLLLLEHAQLPPLDDRLVAYLKKSQSKFTSDLHSDSWQELALKAKLV